MKPWKKYPVLVAILTMLAFPVLDSRQLAPMMAAGNQPVLLNDHFTFIEPGLVQDHVDSNSRVPVIVVFDQGRFQEDTRHFLDQFGGNGFELKRKFTIIPAISGYVAPAMLPDISGSRIAFRMYENKIVALPTDFNREFLEWSQIHQSGSPGWWKDAVGANDPSVAGLTGAGVKVGILDTGIGYRSGTSSAVHVDLSGKIARNVNFANGTGSSDYYDGFGHGTHVAGMVAGSGAASGGLYSGMAPGVELYNVKVLNGSGGGYEDDIILGMEWCANESLDVINLSLGFNSPDPLYPTSIAATAVAREGVVVVASAGNSGPGYFTGGSPGSAEGVITVGATDARNNVTSFSSRGPNLGRTFDPDVLAPGKDIISLLGNGSFMDMFSTYFGLVIEGQEGDGNHYVSSSGTSMSAPVVTAAIALIKENFSAYDLSPAVISMALMETAKDLGYDASTQGAGLINVSAAIEFLEGQKALNNLTSIVRAFPKKVPYAPFDLLDFPGDVQEFNLKLLHAIQQNVTLLPAGLPDGIVLDLPAGNITLENSSGETLVRVAIRAAFNATPGDYNFSILVKNGSNTTMDTVNVFFTLKTPRLKVYIDTYHSLEDQFLYFQEYYRMPENYYLLSKNLSGRNVSITSSMEYLAAGYNASTSKDFLELPLLKNFDVVILPPLRVALLDEEIQALARYREEGGHVVILGSRFQEFARGSANALVAALGIGVEFTGINHEDFTDNGWEFESQPINVTGINESHFLATNVSGLNWDSGVLLENSGGLPAIASDGLDLLIVMENTTGGNGSVLLSGSDSVLTIDPWDPDEANNLQFINNLLDYYIGSGDIQVLAYFPETTFTENSNLTVFFKILNVTSFQALNTTEVSNLSCKIDNTTEITLGMIDGGWMGNANVDVSALANSSEPRVLALNFSIGTVDFHRELAFFKYSDGAVPLNVSIVNNTLYRNESLFIEFNSTLESTTVQVCGLSGNPFSDKAVFTSVQNVTISPNFSLALATSMPAGTYFVNFKGYQSNGNDPWVLDQRVPFSIYNHQPVFKNSTSTFEGTPFSQIDLGNGMVRLMRATTQTELSIQVAAMPDETAMADMDAFVIFYPTFIVDNSVGLIPYGGNLIMERLAYDSSSQKFTGTITIPQGVTFTVDGESISKEFVTRGDYSGALVAILRDDDGMFEYFAILLQISSGGGSNYFDVFYWIFLVGLGVAMVILVLMRRKVMRGRGKRKLRPKKKYKLDKPPVRIQAISRSHGVLRHCPYCGKELKGPEHFCKAFKRPISF